MSSKPFIKWAGGKFKLAQHLSNFLPKNFSDLHYLEPMIGGGGMFFYLKPHNAYLSDINPKLINTYNCIKKDVNSVINFLEDFENRHYENEEFYSTQRDRFNFEKLSDSEMAALFIYLNKTCFNGLYRENSKGEFNVPKGRASSGKATICDKENLLKCSKLFKNINFGCHSYENILSQVNSKSFVYLDPPYIPLKQDSFTKYAKDDFSIKMHYDLNDFCNKLNGLDAKFMLSNSDTSKTREVYKAFNMNEILANRSVGSSSKTRKKAAELIITNY